MGSSNDAYGSPLEDSDELYCFLKIWKIIVNASKIVNINNHVLRVVTNKYFMVKRMLYLV